MELRDTAELLVLAMELDERFRPKDLRKKTEAWHEVVGHLDRGDALEAVRRHYRTSEFSLMPANIISGARAVRRARHGEHPPPPPGTRWAVDAIEADH